MTLRRRLAPVVAAAVAGRGPGSRAPAPAPVRDAAASLVRTDRDVYRATVDSAAVRFTVVVTLANRTADTLTVHPCLQRPPYPPPVSFERLTADGRATQPRAVWSPACTEALMFDPPRLAPGRTRTDTVVAWGSRLPNVLPEFPPGPIEGTYRVVYGDVYRSWHPRSLRPDGTTDLGELVPESLLVSPPFRVTR